MMPVESRTQRISTSFTAPSIESLKPLSWSVSSAV